MQVGVENLIGGRISLDVGYGAAPHAVKVPDPNDPSESTIKIEFGRKNEATKKWETMFAMDEDGFEEICFGSFADARAYGERTYGKKYKPFPEIKKMFPSNLQEVDEGILELLDGETSTQKKKKVVSEEGNTRSKQKPEPEAEPEAEESSSKGEKEDIEALFSL